MICFPRDERHLVANIPPPSGQSTAKHAACYDACSNNGVAINYGAIQCIQDGVRFIPNNGIGI